MSIVLPLCVVAGMLVGTFILPAEWLPELSSVTLASLYVLLVGIGINLVSDSNTLDVLRSIRPVALLIIPFSALGSILGGAVTWMLGGGDPYIGASIGAGFGWYSLSSVLLTEILGNQIGALAFLANTLREIIAVVAMPPLIKRFGAAGIAPGGATTMDTTLPLVSRVANRETVLIALIHGLVLSSLVPILVPMIANLVNAP